MGGREDAERGGVAVGIQRAELAGKPKAAQPRIGT